MRAKDEPITEEKEIAAATAPTSKKGKRALRVIRELAVRADKNVADMRKELVELRKKMGIQERAFFSMSSALAEISLLDARQREALSWATRVDVWIKNAMENHRSIFTRLDQINKWIEWATQGGVPLRHPPGAPPAPTTGTMSPPAPTDHG